MIQVHYRHLPMGCYFAWNQDESMRFWRWRASSELLRADAEGIKIREDRLVWTTIKEITRKELRANR